MGYVAGYWEHRYSATKRGSGRGSRGRAANRKAASVNKVIVANQIRSVVDWGSGDGRVAERIKVRRYTGIEISASAIAKAKTRIGRRPGWDWILYDGEIFPQIRADLALSLDVIFHLVEEDLYRGYMAALFGSAPLIYIHSSNRDEPGCEHVRHRMFTRDIPAGWEIERRPADEAEIGFWLVRKVSP